MQHDWPYHDTDEALVGVVLGCYLSPGHRPMEVSEHFLLSRVMLFNHAAAAAAAAAVRLRRLTRFILI